MKTLFLLACAQQKRPGTHPAQDLYISDLFVSMRRYVEKEIEKHPGSSWAILSAKHGMVLPAQRIESYDLSLSQMPLAQRRGWARQLAPIVAAYLKDRQIERVVWLAGRRYREHLWFLLPYYIKGLVFESPLQSLGIGSQLHWLKERTK